MTDMPEPLAIRLGAPPTDLARPTTRDFATFYAESRDRVYRTVLVATRHAPTAEDATHEAFERALARWDVVGNHAEPAAWVIRVALNQATSWWRRRHRETPDPPERPTAGPADPLDDAVVRAIWALPRRQRQVVALRILADQSIETTAALMGITPGTVKSTLHRALAAVRESLPPETGEQR
jgi:RNA polymerase sigma-70 factor (ECF subfamily)